MYYCCQCFIHVQYTQTESIRLKHFPIRLDSHVTSWLDSHGVASRKSTSGTNWQEGKRFVLIRSNWVESTTFSTTLHSELELNIRKITIHEPSSFLKRATNLSWFVRFVSIRSNQLESTTFSTHPQSPDQLYFLSLAHIDLWHDESQMGKRFLSIRWNRVHESISGLSNRKYQRRIDSSWVYWTTLQCLAKVLSSLSISGGNSLRNGKSRMYIYIYFSIQGKFLLILGRHTLHT